MYSTLNGRSSKKIKVLTFDCSVTVGKSQWPFLIKTVESINRHANWEWSCCWQAVNQLHKITKAQEVRSIFQHLVINDSPTCKITYRASLLNTNWIALFYTTPVLSFDYELKLSKCIWLRERRTSWTPEYADGLNFTHNHTPYQNREMEHSSVPPFTQLSGMGMA